MHKNRGATVAPLFYFNNIMLVIASTFFVSLRPYQ